MTYLITQACCNDASCVAVCPVNCIHPTPAEPQFMKTDMLYIDPQACIDCGACVPACPVNAIAAEDELEEKDTPYLEINAAYYTKYPTAPDFPSPPSSPRKNFADEPLRVAIVGSGPAANYAALELMRHSAVEVNMFERLYTPHGLIRFGVAPDHPGTKAVTDTFKVLDRKPGFSLFLGVEIGNHLSHTELAAHHHAVVYAMGASADRSLGIPGEELPGSHAATDFVAWYNGHPDYADLDVDLSSERAVIVGNGNVALDIARILVTDPDDLAKTDIAPHALDALRTSNIREVVILGRRGPAQAAYTIAEFLALTQLPGIDLVIDPLNAELDPTSAGLLQSGALDPTTRIKVDMTSDVAREGSHTADRRIVLRYAESLERLLGNDRVEHVEIMRNHLVEGSDGEVKATPTGDTHLLEAGLVLRSIGYQGTPLPDLPFDPSRGTIPNTEGRVVDPDTGAPVPGTYVAGWIKRGASGGIGTNKKCAADTARHLVDDYEAGRLPAPSQDRSWLEGLVAERQPEAADGSAWVRLDAAERALGTEQGRPRVKIIGVDEVLAVISRT
ncbi:ferredoxin [Rhodococcus sp. ACS1]|uniref:FAD-dependent oxidoreductase n=1 Tax=Rhodococcus sp. ACS1 TaxID=2028570 RepID=UPI000BB0D527|nr:FAD-dependent oxidoreductase [Rhodococcus sp. ACS1]PBC39466.1 ferredoxin [Rhodococcus sp. ACS1]